MLDIDSLVLEALVRVVLPVTLRVPVMVWLPLMTELPVVVALPAKIKFPPPSKESKLVPVELAIVKGLVLPEP